MPIRIPVYNEQVEPTLDISGARMPTAVPDMGGVARGISALGVGLTNAGDAVEKQQMQDDQASLSKQLGDDTVKWAQYVNTAKTQAAPGAPNFTQDLLGNFDDYAAESLSKTPDGPLKRLYAERLSALRTSIGTNAVTWEAQQKRAWNVQQYADGSDAAARAIAMDPSQYGQSRASQLALINSSSLDAQTKAKLSDQFKDLASTAAGMRMINADPASAYAAMTQDPSKPPAAGYEWVGDLTPQKLTVLQGHAQALVLQRQNSLDAAARQRENDARTAFNQTLDLVNQGKQLSPTYQTTLLQTVSGTSVADETQQLVKEASQNAGFASQPLSAMRAAIQADRADAATPGVGTDPATNAAVRAREKIYTASVDAYKTDPWNAALDRGVIKQVPPVDTSNVQSLDASLAARAAAVGPVENAAGRRVSLLTLDESAQVLRSVESVPIDQQAQMLNGIGGAFGDAARIGDLAQQWHEKDPAMALALKAGAGSGNGDPLMTKSGNPVSTFILSGQQALKDKTVKVDDTVATGMRAQIANAIDNSLSPEQAQDAKESAYYIAIGSAARHGRAAPNATDIQDGINAATGGISTTGGVQTFGANAGKPNMVAMPYGWNEDDFQNAVKTATPANIENTVNGKPIDTVYANGSAIPVGDFMSRFPSYRLVRVGVRGTYAVQAGSKFVTDASGAPVTVHLTHAGAPAAPAAQPAAPASGPDAVANSFAM